MKKMRRLIPAIAMLLVSAVMLSTASFAWFTMNDNATATGMQVQAKASGNLLINTQGLTAADNKIEVEVSNPGKVSLTPITYVEGTNMATTEHWQYATEATKIDPLYGDILDNTTLAKFDASTGVSAPYFAEYVVYLATAGEKLENCDVKVQIHGLAGIDQAIAPAYTIAFWVIEQDAVTLGYTDPDYNMPTHILNYRDGHTNKITITDTAERVDVPSTMGAGADTRVGVKVIMRIYIDGALPTGEIKEEKTKALTAFNDETLALEDLTWGALKETYGAKQIYLNGAQITTDEINTWTADKNMSAYSFWDGTSYDVVEHEECYVNNATVPTGATTFEVDFSVTENPEA